MNPQREQVLNRIRAALGRGDADCAGLEASRARIRQHAHQIEPAFTEPLAERFRDKLVSAYATVVSVDSLSAVATEIERYLVDLDAGKQLLTSGDDLIKQIEWPASIELQQRIATGEDRASVTSALCGIAETGTLMLVSGEQNPTSLNFLPDYHIVVLRSDQLVPRMEDAWDKLRASFAQMPRTVNFISGPSKTADVEQTVEYGAHGPRCLHVVMVG
ncbi:MAG: lactate utilization protein C [Gammaproteobacteria bacterium]|nr:lactate utilization protein C [Gammaproteobacteria bacterium]